MKVLPESSASDRDRLARFQREAQTLASLNHQNIAHIHGLEESGNVRALVMALVDGDDLSQRIAWRDFRGRGTNRSRRRSPSRAPACAGWCTSLQV